MKIREKIEKLNKVDDTMRLISKGQFVVLSRLGGTFNFKV